MFSEYNIHYKWCGRFVAPNDNWIHMSRVLVDYELIVVIEGTLYIGGDYSETCSVKGDSIPIPETATTTVSKEYTVHAGEFILMSPTTRQFGTKNSDCSFYWMHFTATSEDSTDDPLTVPVQSSLRSIDRVILLIKQLQDSDRRYRNSTLNNYLAGALLTELSLQMRVNSEVEQARYREQICHDITDYISWHMQEPLRCSQIAEYFGYNEKYLTTFFKKNMGVSLKNYIIHEKMEHAKVLLTETNDAVSQIAFSLGFADVHNFSNAFRTSVGISPSEYRQVYSKHNVFNK